MGKTSSRAMAIFAMLLLVALASIVFVLPQAQVTPQRDTTMSAQAQSGGLQADTSLAQGGLTVQAAASDNWGLESIFAKDAQAASKAKSNAGDKPVCIAVLDTGFYDEHPIFAGRVLAKWNVATQKFFDYRDANPREDPLVPLEADAKNAAITPPSVFAQGSDDANHGTHAAGIAATIAPDAKLLLIRVSENNGSVPSWALYNAYKLIMAHQDDYNIRVVNFSGGHGVENMPAKGDASYDALVYEQIDDAYAAGVVTVCSAGNEGDKGSYLNYPSDYGTVVSVMSLARTSSSNPYVVERDAKSNYNASGQKTKDICAPGKSIVSAVRKSNGSYDYGAMSGTSMAAPHVAGTLALMFAANSSLTAEGAVNRLYDSATPLGNANGWSQGYGYGEVNALGAVNGGRIKGANSLYAYAGVSESYATTAAGYAGDWELKSSDANVAYVIKDKVYGKSSGTIVLTATAASNPQLTLKKAITIEPLSFSRIGESGYPLQSSNVKVKYKKPTYTGSALMPAVVVTVDGVELKAGTDYKVSFGNNVNAGANAKITVTGLGKYTGAKTYSFEILPASLLASGVTLSFSKVTYNGKARKPVATVKRLGRTLKKGSDYTVSYSGNKNAGTAKVIVKGTGNFKGSVTKTFTITKAKQPMTVKGLSKKVKYSTIRKKDQTLARPITIKKAQGSVTYVKTSGNKKISVNKKTGKVRVRKGLKKGTYKIKIRVTAAGNKNYTSAKKVVTATIVVK